MTGFKKLKWFLAVLGIFLVILATNLIDKKHFLRVEESVENIYNERLLSKELLLDISTQFHKKELAYALNDTTYLKSQNSAVNTEIIELLQKFERVEATDEEERILAKLKANHMKLTQLELNMGIEEVLYSSDCVSIFSEINMNIIELSAEQVREGKNQKIHASDAVDTIKLFSKMEIYMLIILAIILQVIILYNPKEKISDIDPS